MAEIFLPGWNWHHSHPKWDPFEAGKHFCVVTLSPGWAHFSLGWWTAQNNNLAPGGGRIVNLIEKDGPNPKVDSQKKQMVVRGPPSGSKQSLLTTVKKIGRKNSILTEVNFLSFSFFVLFFLNAIPTSI